MDASSAGQSVIALHLRTKNDTNGNPRRLYVLIWATTGVGKGTFTGNVAAVCEEGYAGLYPHRQMVEAFGVSLVQGPSIEITPTEYRDWVKRGKAEGNYHA